MHTAKALINLTAKQTVQIFVPVSVLVAKSRLR